MASEAKRVTLINAGGTNPEILSGILLSLQAEPSVTADPEEIVRSERIILDCTGVFPAVMDALNRSGISDAIVKAVAGGVPILGIDLGMQLLFSGSEENGNHIGMAVFPDWMTLLKGKDREARLPHCGWTTLRVTRPSRLLQGLNGRYFYFCHSYAATDIGAAHVTGVTEYCGAEFVSAAERDNVFGVAFRPEKSGASGLRLLEGFLQLHPEERE